MTRKEVKALVMRLYDAVQESGWSSHKYTDDDWHNLYSIREVCKNVLPDGWKLLCNEVYGYSANGMAKDYNFLVENVETGEQIITCNVRAFAAGLVNNPWSSYDCTALFYAIYKED